MADNDLALGRIIEAVTKSSFWHDTVIFVVEDDAQSGPDHVDSHRAPVWIVSPYSRPGTRHDFFNTVMSWPQLKTFWGWAGCRNSTGIRGRSQPSLAQQPIPVLTKRFNPRFR